MDRSHNAYLVGVLIGDTIYSVIWSAKVAVVVAGIYGLSKLITG